VNINVVGRCSKPIFSYRCCCLLTGFSNEAGSVFDYLRGVRRPGLQLNIPELQSFHKAALSGIVAVWMLFIVVNWIGMAMRWFDALLDHGCSLTRAARAALLSDVRSWVESLSVNLQMLSVLLWGVLMYQRYYLHVPDEYNIYDNLYAKANLLMPAKREGDDDSLPRWALEDDDTGLHSLMRTLETVNAMSLFENLYWSMQFGNAALLFMQLLWMWDWQKHISVVLNTLRTASDTLLHFFLNLGWLLLCYAGLGHVLFGQDLLEYRSFFKALDSLGKFVGFMDYEAIKKVTHQQAASMPFAEQLSIGMFVCSIVVVMYFLLLNFLLVIIGDAMVKTKYRTQDEPRLFKEMGGMIEYTAQRVTWQWPQPRRFLKLLSRAAKPKLASPGPSTMREDGGATPLAGHMAAYRAASAARLAPQLSAPSFRRQASMRAQRGQLLRSSSAKMGQLQLKRILEEQQDMLSYRAVTRNSKKAKLSRAVTIAKNIRKELKGAMQFSVRVMCERERESVWAQPLSILRERATPTTIVCVFVWSSPRGLSVLRMHRSACRGRRGTPSPWRWTRAAWRRRWCGACGTRPSSGRRTTAGRSGRSVVRIVGGRVACGEL
jgi:hypothetical protein